MTLVLLCGLLAFVQQAAPARDADVKPTTGTASISGVVVTDGDQPVPVRRAIVTLNGPDLRPSRGAITDDLGRFTIGNLPPGRVSLTVSKATFITSAYGAKRGGRPGTGIAVTAGAQVTGLTVRLWRGAAISGVVRDELGVPVRNIVVNVMRARAPTTPPAVLTLSNNGTTTNDLGEFRIFGLEPGAYAVLARPTSGGGGPQTTMMEAEVDRLLETLRRRTAAGASTPGTSTPPPGPAPQPFDYSPVYYPGTPNISQATAVVIEAGSDRGGIDITLQRVSAAVIGGVVTRSDGGPAAGASVQLTAVAPPGAFAPETPLLLNATTGPTGAFVISQVTPGDYQLLTRVPVSPPVQTPGVVTPGGEGLSLWGQTDLSVSGQDIRNLTVLAEPGLTMAGRLTFHGESLKPPADLTRLRLFLMPAAVANQRQGTAIRTIVFSQPVAVRANGTFEVTGIAPGPYVLHIQGLPADSGWWLRSAPVGGLDLFDGLVDLARGTDLSNVVVTISDRRTELAGRLQTAAGAPASDVFVIAYAADRRFWGPRARRVMAVRPDVDGRYSMKDLPPGEYLLAAVTDVDPDEWQDPLFLEQLLPASIKLTIGEGEKKIQDLRAGG